MFYIEVREPDNDSDLELENKEDKWDDVPLHWVYPQ